MPTIIDALIVELGLDSKDLEKKAPVSVAALKKLETQGEKTEKSVKTISKTSKETTRSVGDLSRVVTTFLSIIGGTMAIKALISDFVETNAQLYRLSQNLNLSVSTISAWSNASERLGGSAQGLQGTLDMLSKSQTQLMLTGESNLIPYFSALGVSLADVNGKARPVTEILLDLADRFSKMDRTTANNLGRMMGIDQGTMNLLLQGRTELELQIRRQKEHNAVTKAQGEAAQKLQTRIADLKQGFNAFGRDLLMQALPTLEKILDTLQKLGDWAQNNQEFIGDFLKILAVGLGAIALAAMPINLTVLAVIALAAGFALLWDDYQTWARGGKSEFDWGDFAEGIDVARNALQRLRQGLFFVIQGMRELNAARKGDWDEVIRLGLIDPPKYEDVQKTDYLKSKAAGGDGSSPANQNFHPKAANASGAGGNQYQQLAQLVSNATGVPADLIYAQWQHETGGFTNRGARELNNLAGINIPGGKGEDYKSYDSLGDFAADYIKNLARNYPQAMGAQNPQDFANGLSQGRIGSWFDNKKAGSVDAYAAGLNRWMNQDRSGYAQSLAGIPGAASVAANAPQGAGGGSASVDKSIQMDVNQITINTQATDARGIADDFVDKSMDYLTFASQANTGLF